MKKIYLRPYVETTDMRFNYVICGTTGGGDTTPENPDDPYGSHAPRRRVF